jgi:hypothetical protein
MRLMGWRPLRILAVCQVGVLMVSALAFSTQGLEPSMNPARRSIFIPQGAPPKGVEVGQSGFYPVPVYNLDLASNTFYMDAYV